MRPCCAAAATPPHRTWRRRVTGASQWALPITALTLVPKCPACVAGYVLLFTGVGLSIPAAAAIRTALIVCCVGALAALLAKRVLETRALNFLLSPPRRGRGLPTYTTRRSRRSPAP